MLKSYVCACRDMKKPCAHNGDSLEFVAKASEFIEQKL